MLPLLDCLNPFEPNRIANLVKLTYGLKTDQKGAASWLVRLAPAALWLLRSATHNGKRTLCWPKQQQFMALLGDQFGNTHFLYL